MGFSLRDGQLVVGKTFISFESEEKKYYDGFLLVTRFMFGRGLENKLLRDVVWLYVEREIGTDDMDGLTSLVRWRTNRFINGQLRDLRRKENLGDLMLDLREIDDTSGIEAANFERIQGVLCSMEVKSERPKRVSSKDPERPTLILIPTFETMDVVFDRIADDAAGKIDDMQTYPGLSDGLFVEFQGVKKRVLGEDLERVALR